MITQSIQARLYQGFNPAIQRPEKGLPLLSFLDLTVNLQYNDHIAEAELCFTKGGIKYCFKPQMGKLNFAQGEIDLRYQLICHDSDGQLFYPDLKKTFPYLVQEGDNMVYYDATKIGLNSFSEFEMGRLKAAADGYSLLTLGQFFALRGLNGLLHALGFWMQFPFEAESGEFQQPLVVGTPVVTAPTSLGNDGSVSIPLVAGLNVLFSMNPGDPLSWQASAQFGGLVAGTYVVYAMQSNRSKIILPIPVQL